MVVAYMVKLDYRGRIIDRCTREYHSKEWEILVANSRGWITEYVKEII
jgi:hypothetical protein